MRAQGESGRRGLTLIEAMVTIVILTFGLLGASLVVVEASKYNKRALAGAHARQIAEQKLAEITTAGCNFANAADPCENLKLTYDGELSRAYWSPAGQREAGPAGLGGALRRLYNVQVDVDPPLEAGEPVPSPALIGNTIRVTVQVSWQDEGRNETATLQTRISP